MLSTEDTWTRIRLALENGNLSGARMLLVYLPAAAAAGCDERWRRLRGGRSATSTRRPPLKTRAQRELAIYALYKTAESWPLIAADRLRRMGGQAAR